MAGHSKFKNIMHRKGAQDKKRAKIFSRLGREISVAVKEGGPDPDTNIRLRSAVGSAKSLNMPKDNIERAINKSEASLNESFENLRYEGFGPFNVAFVIETLTNNKNRTASNIRTVLQKNGGRLGENGSTTHFFFVCGVIHVPKKEFSDEEILEIAINAGAKDCNSKHNYHEILSEKEDFYKIKNEIEKKVKSFSYSGIEWRPNNYLDISEEQTDKIIKLLESLDEDDDIQRVFVNCKINL